LPQLGIREFHHREFMFRVEDLATASLGCRTIRMEAEEQVVVVGHTIGGMIPAFGDGAQVGGEIREERRQMEVEVAKEAVVAQAAQDVEIRILIEVLNV
jgi:hypothetical protein